MSARERRERVMAQNAALIEVKPDMSGVIELRKQYGVNRYEDFPSETKAKYLFIAACFPGFRVYACGSRVRGDYIHRGHPDSFEQFVARAAAGMPDKEDSDYDFCVEPGAEQEFDLPPWADRARLRIPEKEKIAIPMPVTSQSWDFSRLPKQEHATAMDAFNAGNIRMLLDLHDKYRLSPYTYCCDHNGLLAWFGDAIKNGDIKND